MIRPGSTVLIINAADKVHAGQTGVVVEVNWPILLIQFEDGTRDRYLDVEVREASVTAP